MMRIRVWIRMYFGFSRTETNAFLVLIPVLILILLSEPAYRALRSRKSPDFLRESKVLDSLIAKLRWLEKDSTSAERPPPATFTFHSFDPNSISEKDFMEMGLSKFLAQRMLRFRAKGGRFRSREDVLKIYGMDTLWYTQAERWMTIAAKGLAPAKKQADPKQTALEKIDINLADSLQLVKVYGIGPALSKRIRAFRNKLGGFVSINQLRDVYGLDSVTVEEVRKKFFVSESFMPALRVNLNTATLEELTRNPYIRRREAQAIVSFRMQHGNYDAIDRLKEIQLLTPEWIEKVRPYLTLD